MAADRLGLLRGRESAPTGGQASAGSGLARAGTAAWQFIGVALAVIVAGWAAGQLMPVLLPLGIALLLTALVRPVADRLIRAGAPPTAAALLTMAGLVGVAAGLVALVVPPFVARIGALGDNVTAGAQRVAESVGHDVFGMQPAAVDHALAQLADRVRSHLGGIAGDALTGLTVFAEALGTAVLVVFLCFFLVRDGPLLWNRLVRFLPPRRHSAAHELGRRAWSALTVYARGVVFVATFDAVFIGIALLLVGVPLALPLIVLTWLAAFFPIVGAIVAGAAAVLVTLVADGLTSALIVLAAIVAVQQVEAHVMYPMLVGPRLKLHPIVVLLAVAAGGTIAGVAGAFLAVPVATVCAAALEFAQPSRA